jgi:hypothetical protein
MAMMSNPPAVEQPQVTDPEKADYIDATPTPRWTTADLMGELRVAQSEAEGAASGFGAVFAWAMRQDFDPDHAERVRREAWGRSDTE